MKTPMLMLRTVFILAGVLILLVFGGCNNPLSFFATRQPSPPPSPPPTPVTTTIDPAEQALTTVREYLTALQGGKYAVAYGMLASDAQAKFTQARFEQQGKQGMPLYDLKTAKVTVTGDRAQVTMQLLEDPATGGFHLVREGEQWKVVYRGGAPGMPDAR